MVRNKKNNVAIQPYSHAYSFGFTLLELLIVIAIIGILSAVMFGFINPLTQFQRARDSQRKADLAQTQRALELYYQDNGRYPDNVAIGDYRIKSLAPGGGAVDWGTPWLPFMNTLPKDPVSSSIYIYYVYSTGQAYALYANLERGGKDPGACNTAGTDCPSVPAPNACGSGKACNYGVTSSNVSP